LRRAGTTGDLYAPDEEYLHVAVTRLLPEFYSAHAEAGTGDILSGLAYRLIVRHEDRWLADALKAPHSETAAAAFAALGRAEEAWETRDNSAIAAEARKALPMLQLIGSPAGVLYARFEEALALQLDDRNEKCVSAIKPIRKSLRTLPYAWLDIQSLLEDAICETWTGELKGAGISNEEALQQAARHRYDVLFLRALGSSAGGHLRDGNVAQARRENLKGLALYWDNPRPLLRAHQFYSELALLAEPGPNPYAAAAWARELVSIASIMARANVQATALWQLALVELELGRRDVAYRDFDRAVEADRTLRSEPHLEMHWAAAELDRHELENALTRLLAIRKEAERGDVLLVLEFKAELGRLRLRRGELEESRQLLEEASLIGEKSWSRAREADRLPWMRTMGSVYRGLVECAIRANTDNRQAGALWSQYRARLFARGPIATSGTSSLAPDEGRLTFAELSSGVAAWLETNHGFWFREIESPQSLREGVGRLARDCANFSSPEAVLRADAKELSQRLLGPWDKYLDGLQALVVETDGPVAQVPWAALVRSNGRYWSQDFAVRVRSGVSHAAESSAAMASVERALVVGAPAISGDEGLVALPHAREEAEQVSKLFPRSILLKGSSATWSAVHSELPGAEWFHFAGHGYGGEGGGLVLRGETGGLALLRGADLQNLDLSRCRLVVLGGCSTAAGESDGPGDPQSLVRAFLYAGAHKVVAGLWNLDSAGTQELIREFYREMRSGAPVTESLRRAAAIVRADVRYAHPYYWAGLEVFSSN
jgi:CHAT domain-containing protein